ncbi:acyl-homoserine-lactone synthase [Sphingomonas oryzagri]
MLLTVDGTNRITERAAMRAMFAARKKVFVDLLRWDIPVLDGRFEIDQFDDAHARYIIIIDAAGRHLASTRLLATTRPGILDSLYPELADGPLPAGDDIFEITRFCLTPDCTAAERRIIRNQLVTAIARYALDHRIRGFTGVADMGWSRQILDFGWECSLLGEPKAVGSKMLGALWIAIDDRTLDRLASRGVYAEAQDSLTNRAA